MPKVYILSGAPLSGKSTWAKKQNKPILSCDVLRWEYGKEKYVFNPEVEKVIWRDFYYRIKTYEKDFIIDNTNCKIGYFNKIKEIIPKDWKIEIVKFEVSFITSYCRNIKRWVLTGKWIPFKIINRMKANYKKLHKL